MIKTQFDKIYVISLITNKERQEFITYQFNQLGLEFEFIYGIDFCNFKNISFPDLFDNPKNRTQDFAVAITHYKAVMQAYHLGYNNVLIIEDDVCLNTDISLWETMLNNIPDDADFITFDYRNSIKDVINCMKCIEENNNKHYVLFNDYMFFGGAMYGLMNRHTMQLYLEQQRNEMRVADHVKHIFFDTNINTYMSTKCLFIDQYNYNKTFIQNDNSILEYYDNIYLRIDKNNKTQNYNKDNFFKPQIFHECTRDHLYSEINLNKHT